MSLTKGSRLYVRIDYWIGEKEFSNQDLQDHLLYAEKVAGERYFVGGGFSNTGGGMILLKADNLEEAQRIAQNDPIIEKGFFRYELYEWEPLILSENVVGGE